MGYKTKTMHRKRCLNPDLFLFYSDGALTTEKVVRMKTEASGRTATNGSSRNNVEETKNKNKELLKKKNGCQSFLFLFTFLFSFSLLVPPTSGQYQVYRQDPFAMLSATLQVITFHPTICPLFLHSLYPFKSLLFA